MVDVPDVELESFGPRKRSSPVDLGPPGESRAGLEAAPLVFVVENDVSGVQRPGPDKAHVADDDVPDLGEFIEAGGTQQRSDLGRTAAVHRSELDDPEHLAVSSAAILAEDHRRTARQPHRGGDGGEGRRRDEQRRDRHDQVEAAFCTPSTNPTAHRRNDTVASVDPPVSGVLVLGSHRSGTSVVARLVADLGCGAAPIGRLRPADEFNSGGYFEDRRLIDWHDSMLARCGGWASAPPQVVDTRSHDGESLAEVLSEYPDSPWFVKDPRQCVCLDSWTRARGLSDSAIVVVRLPIDAAASLRRRSSYSRRTSFALWERHNHDLLVSLAGRRTLLFTYESLVDRPVEIITEMVKFLEPVLEERPDWTGDEIAHMAETIRPQAQPIADEEAPPGCAALMDVAAALAGAHDEFPRIELGPVSARSRRAIAGRRRLLNLTRPFGIGVTTRTSFDEVVGKARSRFRATVSATVDRG